ncbi:hypothetical protein AB4620_22635, partial [Vibrio cyclitrophicus]
MNRKNWIGSNIFFPILITIIFLLPPDGHANTTSAVTDVTSDSKFPSDIAEKNKAHFESLKDRAIEITDKQGVWLPKGFFSGPSNNDIFFHQMKLVFGEPVSH